MARAWNELVVRAGLRIAWKEAVWCTSTPDSLEAKIEVDDTEITRTKPWESGQRNTGGTGVDCMEVIPCDTKIVVRQQSGVASSIAPVVIVRHVAAGF